MAPNLDAGEGVRMMFSEMAHADLYPPQYRQNTDTAVESVTVTLFNAKRPSAWDEVSDWIDRHGFIANADVVRIARVPSRSQLAYTSHRPRPRSSSQSLRFS